MIFRLTLLPDLLRHLPRRIARGDASARLISKNPVRRLLLLGAAVMAVLGGCSRDGAARARADGRVVIQYWEKWSGSEGEAMRDIIADFNRSQDRIEVRFLTISPIDVKLLLAASAGNPPDIAGLWSFNIPDFAEKGALTPLDGAIEKSGLGPDHYVPVFWEMCRHRGFTWGLPTTPGCVALYYNKRLFREAGLDPDRPPRTLAELGEMNRRLTIVELERGGRRVQVRYDRLSAAEREARRFALVQVGHLPQDAGMFVSAWGYWFGADYFDGDRRILADEPGPRAALEWLQDTAETFGVENLRRFSSTFGQSQTALSPFLGQASAMVVQGPWMKSFIERFAPDIEWGVAPFPAAAGVAGGAPVTLAECDVLVVPRGAQHPREAFEFIRDVQRRDVAEKLATAQRKFTALREVSPGFLSGHPNPAVPFFVGLVRSPGVRAVPRLALWREFDQEMVVATERVLALRSTPADALAEVQERVQWRLDRAMRRWDVVGGERLAEWRDYDRW